MLLKKVTRLFGFIIGAPFIILLLLDLREVFPIDKYISNTTLPGYLLTLCSILFIVGYFISFGNQILGGLLVFLSPLAVIMVESITIGALRLATTSIFMLVAGTFLLFTSERDL